MHDQLPDKLEDWTYTGAIVTTDISFSNTTTAWLKVKSLTTVQRDALSNTANGDIIYNTTAWEFQAYQGGSWVTVSSWSTQPDASTTVEKATDAQIAAWTATGETGAPLFATPDDLAQQIQSWSYIYGVDAWGDDAYVIALTPVLAAYTVWQLLWFKVTTTNTGACTISFWPSVLNIKTKDWNDPQTGVIRTNGTNFWYYDWTNFVLLQEDFATATVKGVVELATDAEAYTRTDTARAVTPANLAAISQVAILQTTRVANTADGAVTVAHWLSQIPKRCDVVAICTAGTAETVDYSISHWFSNGSTNMCSWAGTFYSTVDELSSWNNATAAINIWVVGTNGESKQTATITFDATNVTLTWDFTEDATASAETIYVTLMVHT